MIDPDGIITSWNAGAKRFKGFEEAEILGQHFSRFYTDEDRRAGLPQRALDTAIREGRFEGEGWRVRKDGSHFWSHVVIDPIIDPSAKLLGFAKITRDITEATQTQQALEKTREALFQAQKMQAVGQLSGGIAHDFNNLLTVILGNLEIIRKRVGDDPKITRLVDNATQGALRGVSLTQRMLAFARRQELKFESVELPTLVEGISGLLRSSLGPSVIFETHFSPELGPVMADVNQLELAVLNLVTNARDAMPDGGKIVISASWPVCLPERHRHGRRNGCRHPGLRNGPVLYHQRGR
jgi:PAS domain S-box-containing protein